MCVWGEGLVFWSVWWRKWAEIWCVFTNCSPLLYFECGMTSCCLGLLLPFHPCCKGLCIELWDGVDLLSLKFLLSEYFIRVLGKETYDCERLNWDCIKIGCSASWGRCVVRWVFSNSLLPEGRLKMTPLVWFWLSACFHILIIRCLNRNRFVYLCGMRVAFTVDFSLGPNVLIIKTYWIPHSQLNTNLS